MRNRPEELVLYVSSLVKFSEPVTDHIARLAIRSPRSLPHQRRGPPELSNGTPIIMQIKSGIVPTEGEIGMGQDSRRVYAVSLYVAT